MTPYFRDGVRNGVHISFLIVKFGDLRKTFLDAVSSGNSKSRALRSQNSTHACNHCMVFAVLKLHGITILSACELYLL